MVAQSGREMPHILHSLRGRMRVHLPDWSGQNAGALEHSLCQVEGVRQASASPLTGNILISFDPERVCAEEFLARLHSFEATHSMATAEPMKASMAGEAYGLVRRNPVLQAGVVGIGGHALLDLVFYAVVFSEPFGLPLAWLGFLHLTIDVFIWSAALATLLVAWHGQLPVTAAV